MLAFILQSLLLILIAFFLGWLLGRWIKSLFCRRTYDQHSYADTSYRYESATNSHSGQTTRHRVNDDSNTSTIAKGAAVVAGAATATKLASDAFTRDQAEVRSADSDVNLPETDTSIDLSDVALPETDVSLDRPSLDGSLDLPEVDVKDYELPDREIGSVTPVVEDNVDTTVSDLDAARILPDDSIVGIELPDTDATLEAPEINITNTEQPDIEIDTAEMPTIDSDVDINLPEHSSSIERPEDSIVDAELSKDEHSDSEGLSDTLKGAALAAAGSIAATSLTKDDEVTDASSEHPNSDIENTTFSEIDTPASEEPGEINTSLENSEALTEEPNHESLLDLDNEVETSQASSDDINTDMPDSEQIMDIESAEQTEFVLDSGPESNEEQQTLEPDETSLQGTIATAAAAGAASLAVSKTFSETDESKTTPTIGEPSSIEGLYTDNLQIFEGIGPKMEEILQSNNIHTWHDLSQQSESDIRGILDSYGDQYQGVEHIDSWITQAKLASDGKLTELIELQKEDGVSKIERMFGATALEQASENLSITEDTDHPPTSQDENKTLSSATTAAVGLSTLATVQGIRSVVSINDEMAQLNLKAGESLELNPQQYDKLGILHCGVTQNGFVSVVGDVATLEDKQTLFFERNAISVSRDDDTFTFTKWLKETS